MTAPDQPPARDGQPRPAAPARPGGAALPPPPYRPGATPPARPRAGVSGARTPAPGTHLPPVPPVGRSAARTLHERDVVSPVGARTDQPLEGQPRRRPVLPPVPPPRRRGFVPGPDDTQFIPVLPPVPHDELETEEETQAREGSPGGSRGILRAAGTMAVATLVSRLTGFLRTVVLTAVLGLGLVNDAYTVSNTLPNLVYELLLGGVLTSVVVPLLVNAQEKHRDGGVRYTQRLMTIAVVGLSVLTVVAVLAAPGLTWLLNIRDDPEQVELANWLARILLVEIVFYGVGALAGAVLNARGVFGPPAWAPVLNNVVVIATGALFVAASGPGDLTPATITPGQVWLLGIGTTLGIAVQSLVLLPLLPRHGVPLRPRWGLRDTGLREAGTLGLWVVGYVLVSQVGVIVTNQVANDAAHDDGLGPAALANASLLFQMPYGIIGVALLTALLPRMSRAAARSDVPGVVADLALGTRLSAMGLLPVTALLVVLGPAASTVAFFHGQTTLDDARAVGTALAVGAAGLLPMAVTLLQLRVFYAMKDAKTPTLIQLFMVAVRVPLVLLVPVVTDPRHVVAGLMLVTSITFVVGWVVGDVALRRRLGSTRGHGVLSNVLRMAVVSAVAAVAGGLVSTITDSAFGRSVPGSLVTLVVGTVVIGVAVVAGAVVARVPEIGAPLSAVRARLGRH
ncbi:murein biosynthesis integral membrane protein MurJ [Modestobacter sp. NPDC049651]|uniref:murein biosynthesis integral membrane protein MurJ n=1 Tax=unclassified Modestobacter TaxID=2643866 RepID=UPI0033EBDC46